MILPIDKDCMGKGRDTFCLNCLTHDRHFKGGHSWTPDLCPCGSEDTVNWKNMSINQKRKAQIIYNKNESRKNEKS